MARLHAFLASGETLDLPTNERPTVSILIVLYNGAELTFACLESLRECVRRQAVEVIILDNGSTDLTAALLARLRGAKVIRNSENMHYLRGVNRAAREAGGDYLLC